MFPMGSQPTLVVPGRDDRSQPEADIGFMHSDDQRGQSRPSLQSRQSLLRDASDTQISHVS